MRRLGAPFRPPCAVPPAPRAPVGFSNDAALAGDNLFAVLMDAVRVCSLGQITDTLFEVGGRYRRNV